MSNGIKTVFFYVGGLFILVTFSIVATRQSDGDGFVPPTATLTPPSTATPVAAAADCSLTPASQRRGYRSGAPQTTQLTPPPEFEWRDQRLIVSGRVLANDCRTPLSNLLVEVWHANPEGIYDQTDNFYLRGQLRTDNAGRYKFTTLAPGRYRIGAGMSPAHIHFRFNPPEASPIYTQLYFSDDPYLDNLPARSAPLVAKLSEKAGANGITWRAQFDVVLSVPPACY